MNSSFEIFIVTGYSGAGKSTVLRALEDLDFYCVDNLPINFLNTFLSLLDTHEFNTSKIALGIDIRAGANINKFIKQQTKYITKIIFLTASKETLLKRFQETRRRHPLNNLNLPDAIDKEIEYLGLLKNSSDLVIETDQFNIHQLRAFIYSYFAELKIPMTVNLTSFGFKYGVPSESNFIYDLRSLPNPYFISNLRKYDGNNKIIHDYLFDQPDVREYFKYLKEFISYSIDKFYKEGRLFMYISLGCTGGRHRSVAFVQELAQLKLNNVHFLVKHRDIHKDNYI